jgi:O-antigen/teichoic acid export membrane protein
VWTAVGAQVIAQTVHALVAVYSARAALRRDAVTADEGVPPAPGALAMLRSALPLALSWVFIALYFRIDAVMLHALKDSHAVGLYGGVYRIFEAFVMLTAGFRSVLFPLLARAADGPAEGLAVLCRKSLRLQALFTVLVAVAFGAVAEPLLVFVLGPDYAEAALGLRVLLWALPGSFMADLILHVLVAQGRPSAGTWVVGVTAVLNISLNLVLIPRFSFVGAAAATVVSEMVCLALLYHVVSRGVPGVGLGALLVRPLIAGGVTAFALFVMVPHLPAGPWGVLLGLSVATLLYGSTLLVSGGLGATDVAVVRGLVTRRVVRPSEHV